MFPDSALANQEVGACFWFRLLQIGEKAIAFFSRSPVPVWKSKRSHLGNAGDVMLESQQLELARVHHPSGLTLVASGLSSVEASLGSESDSEASKALQIAFLE